MTEMLKEKTLETNERAQWKILNAYYPLGDSHSCYTSYDDYTEQRIRTNFKNDIDEYYRLSCINLLVKGYDV